MVATVGLLVGVPLLLGLLNFPVRRWPLRIFLVFLAAGCTLAAAIALVLGGTGTETLHPVWSWIGAGLEVGIIAWVVLLGVRLRSWSILVMGLAQLGLSIASLALPTEATHGPKLLIDPLALIMVLIISGIGSVIAIYAIGYMKNHEHHAPPTAATTGRFFAILIAFLGLMNGLVLVDDLKWLAFFWEATTLCSFFLIGHDGTEDARKCARRALIINTFGGLGMSLAGFMAHAQLGTESLGGLQNAAAILPLGLLILATMTKSAQMPFQSWLLGAMVAPTPVSALLHSSTMVKAGSYLVLRLAPGFGATPLAPVIAIAGAFTFVACSALAIGQSNAKKVLAYSTIANLGLIVACAGINTPLAIAAALMILCFHALSKALLFLSVGVIEQRIGSRHVEDMSGLLFRMPLVTIVTIIGMISMMAPPFGMIVGKWIAIESAVKTPVVLFPLVIGSALTIFFWAKWLGRITTASYHPTYKIEGLRGSLKYSLLILAAAVLTISLQSMALYHRIIKPVSLHTLRMSAEQLGSWSMLESVDSFRLWPVYLLMGLTVVAIAVSILRFTRAQIRPPYLCGENVDDAKSSFRFRTLMDHKETALLTSYYMSTVFGEARLTAWCNPIAALILITLLGVLVTR